MKAKTNYAGMTLRKYREIEAREHDEARDNEPDHTIFRENVPYFVRKLQDKFVDKNKVYFKNLVKLRDNQGRFTEESLSKYVKTVRSELDDLAKEHEDYTNALTHEGVHLKDPNPNYAAAKQKLHAIGDILVDELKTRALERNRKKRKSRKLVELFEQKDQEVKGKMNRILDQGIESYDAKDLVDGYKKFRDFSLLLGRADKSYQRNSGENSHASYKGLKIKVNQMRILLGKEILRRKGKLQGVRK